MRLWDPGARAERALAASHEKMVAKLSAGAAVGSFVSRLANEGASASAGHSGGARMSGGQDVSAWVAEGLESSRPPGRTARSADPDGHGRGRVPLFNIGGVWGARRPDVQGNIPYERWPAETSPGYEPAPYLPWPGASSSGCTCGSC